MLTWFRRIILLFIFLSLLITHVLTLSASAVNFALSGLVASALGISTATGLLHKKIASQKAANAKLRSKVALQKSSVRSMGQRLASRSKRIAAFSVGEIPASVIPFAGMALLAAGAVIELKLLCDGLKDMEALYAQMEIEEDLDADTLHAVCHPSIWGSPEEDPD